MKNDVNPWERMLWGVVFTSGLGDKVIIGEAWHAERFKRSAYPSEPTRALLFMSRSAARDWCRDQNERYRGREGCLAQWRFTPVKVRESVKIV